MSAISEIQSQLLTCLNENPLSSAAVIAHLSGVNDAEAEINLLNKAGLVICAVSSGSTKRWKLSNLGRDSVHLAEKSKARGEHQRQWKEQVSTVASFLRDNSDTSFTEAELSKKFDLSHAACRAAMRTLKRDGHVRSVYWKRARCLVWMVVLDADADPSVDVANAAINGTLENAEINSTLENADINTTDVEVSPSAPTAPASTEAEALPASVWAPCVVTRGALTAPSPATDAVHSPSRPSSSRSSISSVTSSCSSVSSSASSLTSATSSQASAPSSLASVHLTSVQRTVLSSLVKHPLSSHGVIAHLSNLQELDVRKTVRLLCRMGFVVCAHKGHPSRWQATSEGRYFMATGKTRQQTHTEYLQRKQVREMQQLQWEADVQAVAEFLLANDSTEAGLNRELGLAHKRCRAILHALQRAGDAERAFWPEWQCDVWTSREHARERVAVCA